MAVALASENITEERAKWIVHLINRGYSLIYENEEKGNEWKDFRYWVERGDYVIQNHKRIVCHLAEVRGDFFSSDREVAALAIALHSCGYYAMLQPGDSVMDNGYAVITEYADGTEKRRVYKRRANADTARKKVEQEIRSGSREIRGVWLYEGNHSIEGLRPWRWPMKA